MGNRGALRQPVIRKTRRLRRHVMRCSGCMPSEQRSVRLPIGLAGIERRSTGSSAAIGKPMAATCPRPRNASPGPGGYGAQGSSAAASSATWCATSLRWGGRPSRSPADYGGRQPSTGPATSPSTAGSTARAGGASASSATWRGPSHAGAGVPEPAAGSRRSRTARHSTGARPGPAAAPSSATGRPT